ncbi:MAG: FAD-dependent oxidoreductase [Pseudomonadota bacterium]
MSEFPSTARVVIIGGGCVGASALYHLAKAGWSDCVLLEKNELTAGSTWHAAGNIPTFSSSWSIMNMQRYSTELYRGLGEEVDYPMNYHVTGSIRLGHSKERRQEFERVMGMGRYQGMDINLMSPSEAKDMYPFMEMHDLEGVLYDPYDGDIDPAQLTQALATGARKLGARIERFCPATGARRKNDEWVISTPKGEIRCEYVVNAAGYYAREVGKWFGRDVPMMVMSHQYLLFDTISEIEEWSSNNGGKKLPLLRDVDSSYYLRQEKFGLNLGPYERNCKAHWITDDDPFPDDFSFQLFPDDLDRLEWYVTDAMERVPLMAEASLTKIINGPIPYSPDGYPLIGPMPGVPNAFEACVFTFGICQAGGAGKVLAEWITEGSTEWDMWSVDPRRFTGHCDEDYCIAKGMEVYGHEYAMHFPHHAWPAGRDKKLSPIHDRIVSMGGQMGAYNGWERANWFAKPGDDTSEEATQTWSRSGPWEPRVKEECEAVRDSVGLLDLPGFSRFRIEGANAAGWLDSLVAGRLPKVGRISLGYFPDARGRIVTEMSITRPAEDRFYLITAAPAQWHDYELLKNALPIDGSVTLQDITDDYSTLILTGPNSRSVLTDLCGADLSQPWLSQQYTEIDGAWIALSRVSFAGELGWELHLEIENAAKVYDAVTASGGPHGLKPFGMFALNSLRLEKGYRAWKGDLSTDYTLLEGGLDRFIKLDKEAEFPGKQALLVEKQRGVSKRFVTMTIDAGEYDAPYMSTVWAGDEVVGETTSGGWGYRVNKSIALGMVRSDLATPGTELDVEIFGTRHAAMIHPDQPLWDPENARLRA